MNFSSNAADVHKPLGKYFHTTLVPASARWLVVSGQVGIDKNGKLATNLRKQAEQCFRNILACLRENRMRKGDLVKTTVYLTDSRFVDGYRLARSRIIGDATLIHLDAGDRRRPGIARYSDRNRGLGGQSLNFLEQEIY